MKHDLAKLLMLLLTVLLLSVSTSAQIHAEEAASVQIIQQPQSQAVHEDGTISLTVIATGTNLWYRWQYRYPNFDGSAGYTAWYDCTSATPGYNRNTLTLDSSRANRQYRCLVGGNGESVYSDVVTLTLQKHSFMENILVLPTCSEDGRALYSCECGATKDGILPYLGHSFSKNVCEKCGMTATVENPENQTVCVGRKASFSVKVYDPAATYQWQYRWFESGSWINCSTQTQGYTTSRITVEGATARDGYGYRCKITFKCESGKSYTVYSEAATLNVHNLQEEHTYSDSNAVVVDSTCTKKGSISYTCVCGYVKKQYLPLAPHGYEYGVCRACSAKNPDYSAITENPRDSFVKQGGKGDFSVVADVKDPVYRWQYQLRENGPWFNTSSYTTGYNSDTLTVVAEAKRDGFRYRCRITDASGNKYYSQPAVLDVDIPAQNAFALQPEAKWVMEGNKAVFSVIARGSVASIGWQYQTAPGKAWYNSTAATQGYNTDTLTVNAEAKRNGFSYRCVITDTDGYIHISDEVTLTVTAAQFDADPQSVAVAAGEKPVFSAAVSGAYTQIYWQYSKNGGESWYASSSSFPGYNTTAMTVEATAARNGFLYRCVIIDANGTRIHSKPAALTVE